jgi:hypothetical protein
MSDQVLPPGVEFVSSNLKNGASHRLGTRTLLIGSNGSGKTAVVQAIELALLGAEYSSVQASFPRGEAHPQAEVETSVGQARWEANAETGEVEHFPAGTPVELLGFQRPGAVGGFQAWVSGVLSSQSDWRVFVPSEEDQLVVESLVEEDDALAQVATKVKSWVTKTKRACTRKERAAEKGVEGLDAPLAPADRERLQARAAGSGGSPDTQALQAYHQAVADHQQAQADAQAWHRLLAEAHQIEADQAQRQARYQELLPVEEPTTQQTSLIQLLTDGIDIVERAEQAAYHEHDCLVCGAANGRVEARRRAQLWRTMLAEAKVKTARWEEARTLQAQWAQAQESYQALVAFFQVQSAPPSVPPAPTRPEAEAQEPEAQGAAQELLAQDAANQRAWAARAKTMAAVEAQRALAERLTRARKAMEKQAKAQGSKGLEEFMGKAQGYLPEGWDLGIDLEGGTYGLFRGEDYHTDLSGAERVVVDLALTLAAADWAAGPEAEEGSTLRVYVTPDIGWDSVTLGQALDALSCPLPCQVIISSTVPPLPKQPREGWVLVPVGE